MGLDLPHTKRKRVEMKTTTRHGSFQTRVATAVSVLFALVVNTFGAEVYREDFSGDESLADRGFTGIAHWEVNSEAEVSVTRSPGGWTEYSAMTTPSFDPVAYEEDRSISVSFKIRYPTEYNKSWRENNKLYVYFLDDPEGSGYRIGFKPNQEADRHTSPDLYLYKVDDAKSYTIVDGPDTKIDSAWTHTLAPHGAGSDFVTLKVTISHPGVISVSYDGGGEMVEYLIHEDADYGEIGCISYEYKTGSGDNSNYFVEVDDIVVVKQDPPEEVTIDPGDDVDITAVLRRHRDNFQDRLNVQFLEGTYKYGVTVAAPGMTYKLR